ncbi:MAG: glycoside hydrolase family 38 C-terminal domain-containing protein [Acidobacteriota bacterium]
MALANHWSYIGIGWQLGLESCVLSVIDSLEMADHPPFVKTCINLEAYAYELLAEKYPELIERLKQSLAAGKVELIGGSFGQPLGSQIGAESNIRQLVCGRETIRKALGYEVVTFLEEEEFTHPQMPQILVGAGFRYASLAQIDTWGRAGVPRLELNVLNWKGTDGATIPSMPKNSLRLRDPERLAATSGEAIRRLQKLGKPLLLTWAEFGWEPPEAPAYLTEADRLKRIPPEFAVEYVTLREYMEKYGRNPKETVYLNMDAWKKVLPWGIGGDQLRILDRKVEALLLAAETFDAVASSLGAKSMEPVLEKAWRDLLIAQSHDVSLCEYSRWQDDRMAPADRIEDRHNFTWGAIGYNHLDSAQRQGRSVLDASLRRIADRVDSGTRKGGRLAVVVFNSCGWERTDLATTGRVYPGGQSGKRVVVRDSSGRTVPSQLIKSERDSQGNLLVADVALLAENVPSAGYDTYSLEFTDALPDPPDTGLRIDESRLEIENEQVKLRLDPANGALTSLVDKKTGREMLGSLSPVFKGRPNPQYAPRSIFIRRKYAERDLVAPTAFDSSQSKAAIRWIEKGPLRATVAASHSWPLLKFETRITLCARSPRVEVMSRVLAEAPPALDAPEAEGRLPLEIKEGYWLCFAPGFEPASVLRDFAFAIEPTAERRFHALTLVDFLLSEGGLLLLHAGTQYFWREDTGVFSNLLMREWESYWTGEYGWPRYAEYRHALVPHRAGLTHAGRSRASAEFTRPLVAVVAQPRQGSLPRRKSFVRVDPANVQLSAFRMRGDGMFELRLAEAAGEQAAATVELGFPVGRVVETDLLGGKVAEASLRGARLGFHIAPWRIRTFELRR